jgi:hypothetical protein
MKRVVWKPPCRRTLSKLSPQAYGSQQRLPVQRPGRWAARWCSPSVDRDVELQTTKLLFQDGDGRGAN